jgi:anti-sigma regulatory factor (Ser/Thr protein kinase)
MFVRIWRHTRPTVGRTSAWGVDRDGLETNLLFAGHPGWVWSAPMYDCTFSLRPSVESVRFSRQVIRGALATFDTDFVEAAAVLTDELVANAVSHGSPPIVLEVKSDEERLTVAVTDAGPGTPVPQPTGPRAECGRGLVIVSKLSDTWGVSDLPKGKCVWFELKVKRCPA